MVSDHSTNDYFKLTFNKNYFIKDELFREEALSDGNDLDTRPWINQYKGRGGNI
jgi:hypothetical protein